MISSFQPLVSKCIEQKSITRSEAVSLLNHPNHDILSLLNASYKIRQHFCQNTVQIHIINNVQNGYCPEDCSYCVQSKNATAPIQEYGLKSDEEILAEAKKAYESGAFRYCMVFSGRGPKETRVKKMASLVQKIKAQYPLEICISSGLLDESAAHTLKEAGLDRLNHNLNTAESTYKKICTTHTYEDRLNTLKSAQKAGLELCSGVIIGMGETNDEIIDLAFKLRETQVHSIPVNFFIPVPGAPLTTPPDLTPQFCLKVLALFRFINPNAEIRIAAGRELHLRSMQALALYPANSLFMDGYLNTTGSTPNDTIHMILDAGFTIQSESPLVQEILKQQKKSRLNPTLKTEKNLRPALA